ncbi:MAG: hypothetical protein IJE65_02825 [Clostridia bacterium]|nr:hypothetical protein [Clostridia bacterium]
MKKCLHLFFVLAVICCMIAVSVPTVCAEEDDYYYYKVKITTKIDGDELLEDTNIYYSLHGVDASYENFVMSAYSVDGIRNNHRNICLQPGVSEQTNELVFRSEQSIIGIRLLQEYCDLPGLTFDTKQYYLDISAQEQHTGIENCLEATQMCMIEGFADGGAMILSELRNTSFTLNYKQPPMFSGVEDYGQYFTTQKVVVKGKNMQSITLNGEEVEIQGEETVVSLPADKNTTYTITATNDAATCELTVFMYELEELMTYVSDINEKNVKSEHMEDILMTLDYVDAVIEQGTNATAKEKARLNEMKKELEGLLSRIDEVNASLDSESIKQTKDITADNVKPEDKKALDKAASDIKKMLKEYDGNYTDDQKKTLNDDLTRIKDALKVISKQYSGSPKTGDNSNISLLLALFMLNGVALVALKRKIA